MQAKDIPELPILRFISAHTRQVVFGRSVDPVSGHVEPITYVEGRCSMFQPDQFDSYPTSVFYAMPEGTPYKVGLAKMRRLIDRGLVDGCACGCRGNFALTDKGMALVLLAEVEA